MTRLWVSINYKMANPKYAGLPGIAPPTEKDVYETDDLPEADQDNEFIEAESENIERPHLDISSAHTKFKNKILICGKDVDFSDKYRRRRHTGYHAISGEWEIAGENEEETIFQRCNRLQCEYEELLKDINKLKETEKEEKKKELEVVEPLVPQLQQSLQQINSYLNYSNALGDDFMKFMSDPQETQIRRLISKLEELKELGGSSGSSGKSASKSKTKENDSVVTYHLQTFPAQNKFIQTARVASLEQRISKLENVIGATSENLERLALSEFKSLMQASKEISARVNMIDSAQVEKIEKNLGAILAKMDSLVEKRGGQEMIDKEKKIDELYESLGKTVALNESIKPIMERLIALKSLHMEAGEFKKSLKELETDQINTCVTIANNEAILKSIKESLEKHLEVINKNIKALNDRLSALKK